MRNRVIERAGLALTLLFLAAAASASALDIEDVKNLMRSQVGEEVIINMAKADGRLYITMEEAEELRRMGASENLIAALRPTATTTAPAPMRSAPTVVQSLPAPAPAATITTTEIVEEFEEGTPITAAPVTMQGSYPPRYDKEGWLSISNMDWETYYVNIHIGDRRIFIGKAPNGGMAIQSGQNVIVNLKKNNYRIYGDSGNKLEARVRENETTILNLNPFGVVGNSGLSGTSIDRDRVRSEVLFNNYVPVPTVVVQEPSVIVVPATPPPVYYYSPPYYRPYYNDFYFRYRRW